MIFRRLPASVHQLTKTQIDGTMDGRIQYVVTLTHPTNVFSPPPKRPCVLVRLNSVSPTKPARHLGVSSEDCLIERAGLLACTVPKRTFGENVYEDRFNLQRLSLTFVRKTPRPFFISFDSPFYRVSLPRGLSLLYSVNLSPFISVF